MLTIEAFARHGCVPVPDLRRYDGLRLLTAEHLLYHPGQFGRLNRIVALAGLGFGPGQIREVLDEPLPAAELRGMLRLRQAGKPAGNDTWWQVEARIRAVETEAAWPTADVAVERAAAVETATIHHAGSFDDHLVAAQTLAVWMADHGRRPAGDPWEVHGRSSTELRVPLV